MDLNRKDLFLLNNFMTAVLLTSVILDYINFLSFHELIVF